MKEISPTMLLLTTLFRDLRNCQVIVLNKIAIYECAALCIVKIFLSVYKRIRKAEIMWIYFFFLQHKPTCFFFVIWIDMIKCVYNFSPM